MSLRSAAIKIYSGWRVAKLNHDIKNPIECQEKIFSELLTKGRKTAFGRDHNFDKVDSYEKWIHSVPLRKYQEYEPYIDRIFKGEDDVLWPGRPMYFVGTAGTTGGVKYIPLTGDSLPYHLGTARDAVIYYCMHHGLMDIFDGKMLFLSGSPVL